MPLFTFPLLCPAFACLCLPFNYFVQHLHAFVYISITLSSICMPLFTFPLLCPAFACLCLHVHYFVQHLHAFVYLSITLSSMPILLSSMCVLYSIVQHVHHLPCPFDCLACSFLCLACPILCLSVLLLTNMYHSHLLGMSFCFPPSMTPLVSLRYSLLSFFLTPSPPPLPNRVCLQSFWPDDHEYHSFEPCHDLLRMQSHPI